MGTASGNLLLVALLAAAALAATAATRPDVTEAATAPARTVAAVDSLEPAVLAGINKARKARGLRPLRASGALARAATRHARSMAREGYFSHTSGDGTGPSARIRRFYGGSAVGENTRTPDSPGPAPQLHQRLPFQSQRMPSTLLFSCSMNTRPLVTAVPFSTTS